MNIPKQMLFKCPNHKIFKNEKTNNLYCNY